MIDGVTIPEAAEILGLSVFALKQRITRAQAGGVHRDAHGTDISLGHGVTAFKPTFQRHWLVYIPKRVARAVKAAAKHRPKSIKTKRRKAPGR